MPFINNLLSNITNLRTKVGEKLNLLYSDIGIKGNLTTANKDNLVGAVNEINSKFIPYENAIKDVNLNNKSLNNVNNTDTKSLKISNLNGILKTINGVVTIATPQVDYLTSVDLSAYATQSWVNSQGFLKSIPIATPTVLGGIKVGTNLNITADGILSAVDTKYTAGNGLTLTNVEFSLPVSQTGSGIVVKNVTQNANGISVNSGDIAFSELINKPTTVEGYAISNAMTTSHPANIITSANIVNWNTAFGWGNHALVGYMDKNALNSITDNWSIYNEINGSSIFGVGTNVDGYYIGRGGQYARYAGNGIFPELMVPGASYQFQNLYFPKSTNKSRLEDRVLVTSVNGVKADDIGNVTIPTGGGGVDPSNFVLKNANNNITTDFSLYANFGYPSGNNHSFSMYGQDILPYPVYKMGMVDSNGEGVTIVMKNDSINLTTIDGGEESMVMNGRKITFDRFVENKLPNDVAQIQDIELLKQWITANFLSLNGGTVNGVINANAFYENT